MSSDFVSRNARRGQRRIGSRSDSKAMINQISERTLRLGKVEQQETTVVPVISVKNRNLGLNWTHDHPNSTAEKC